MFKQTTITSAYRKELHVPLKHKDRSWHEHIDKKRWPPWLITLMANLAYWL